MNIEKEINDSKKKPEDLVDSSSTKLKENKKKAKISEPKLEKDEEITQLKENIANLKKEIEILKKKNLRLLADSDNQKKEWIKEMEREKATMEERIKYGNEKLLNQLLFFPDNYERALQAVPQIEKEPKQNLEKELNQLKNQLQKETNLTKKAELESQKKKIEQQIQNLEIIQQKIEKILEGLQMVLTWFRNFLRKQAVEEIEVVPGKDIFDGELHEFLQEEENNDYPAGTILQVLQKGYKIRNRVLRPAAVKISKISNKTKEIEKK